LSGHDHDFRDFGLDLPEEKVRVLPGFNCQAVVAAELGAESFQPLRNQRKIRERIARA
jgi:hypothetical protein